MSLVNVQQTDSPAGCGWILGPFGQIVACSGIKGAGSGGQTLNAAVNGTPGTVAKRIRYAAGVMAIGVVWQAAPGDVTWNAGTWVVRLNVTAPPAQPGWIFESIWICRINAACQSVATVASLIGFHQAISNQWPAVYSIQIAGGVAQPDAAPTDEIYWCLLLWNNTGGQSTFNITSDQMLRTSLTTKGYASRLVNGGILPPQSVDGVLAR